MGTKLFISRPGVEEFLVSFNFGFRIRQTMMGWSACELEALSVNKGINHHAHFFKITQMPGIILVDSKATFQAKQRLDRGQVSKSIRLQDLLVNMSAKRLTIQLISATTPSSILTLVDFASRNPVPCDVEKCSICKDVNTPCTAFLGAVAVQNPSMIPNNTWRDIQASCKDLARVYKYLRAGKYPHKKEKNMTDIRRYLQKCSLNKNGLIVVKKSVLYENSNCELIVIPRFYALTLLSTLHVELKHPHLPEGEYGGKYNEISPNTTRRSRVVFGLIELYLLAKTAR